MKIKIKSDLFDLSIKKELNQSIWDGEKLNTLVRERLLKIADDFIEDLEIVEKEDIEDIRLTGSLANYNYTSYSDIDLHVIIDFQKLSADEKFIESFFKNKRTIWNNEHDIFIKGFDVELYVEDDNEEHHSTGIYSVLNDEWYKKPKPTKKKIDKKAVLKKVQDIIDLGAGDRATALRWMLQGDQGDEELDLYAIEWFTMSRGIDYTDTGRKVEKELLQIANENQAFFGIAA